MRVMHKRLGTIILGAVLALSAAACTTPNENPSDQPPTAENRPTELSGISDVVGGESKTPSSEEHSSKKSKEKSEQCTAEDITVNGYYGSKPSVEIPQDCAAPTKLLTEDLKVGNGPEVTKGSTLRVRYQLVVWSSGKVVDGNFGSGQLYTVKDLPDENLIEGWNKGLLGMHEGGRRLLVVPAEMAYGNQGSLAGKTLVFVVDAVRVQPA